MKKVKPKLKARTVLARGWQRKGRDAVNADIVARPTVVIREETGYHEKARAYPGDLRVKFEIGGDKKGYSGQIILPLPVMLDLLPKMVAAAADPSLREQEQEQKPKPKTTRRAGRSATQWRIADLSGLSVSVDERVTLCVDKVDDGFVLCKGVGERIDDAQFQSRVMAQREAERRAGLLD